MLASISPARGQAGAEDRRPDQFVDGDEGHEQHLHLSAPGRELGREHRRQPQRDARLRDQPRPRVRARARIHGRVAQPDGQSDANQPDAECDQTGRRRAPIVASASKLQRGADRDEEDDEHRKRAALKRHLERVALRHGEVLDDQAGRHRREQRLEPLCGADLAEHDADANQHDGGLASDIAEIQREQRAHEAAERDGAANLPAEPHEDADVARRRPG